MKVLSPEATMKKEKKKQTKPYRLSNSTFSLLNVLYRAESKFIQ